MRTKAEDPSTAVKDPDRFYCPFPGCNRSFAELWRLKVHYRAPPDVRGSGELRAFSHWIKYGHKFAGACLDAKSHAGSAGKERGHGTELTHCPKCGKGLKPGKHHVGCSATKPTATPRTSSKRQKLVSTEFQRVRYVSARIMCLALSHSGF
jgi:hypothetical protein